MNKILIIAASLIIFIFIASSTIFFLQRNKQNQVSNNSKILVTTSFYPLYDFTNQVGGDNIQIKNITPPGVDPHEYDPSPEDLKNIYGSELFVYQGQNFEPWSSDAAAEAGDQKVETLNIASNFQLALETEEENIGGKAANPSSESKTDSKNDVYNPHTWLDPINAIKEVELIRDRLIKLDPNNLDRYNSNTQKYISELNQLDAEYKNGLKQCKQNTIVVSHDAYIYMAQRYGFKTRPIAGLEPSDEPSPQELAKITDIIKQIGIKYVFYESQVSPKLSQTVAMEAGASTLVLNSIESPTPDELTAKADYISLMKQNLTNLELALECTPQN